MTLPFTNLGEMIVSRLALGTMTFGVETSESEAFAQLDRYEDAGGNLIDTADVYGDGESERIIGRWLKARPSVNVHVATKGRFAPPEGAAGASRRSLVHGVDASLSRLGIESIDLYFVHGWDVDTPVEETLDTLTDLVHSGKIRTVGWSNVTGWQLAQIMTTATMGDYVVPRVLQPQYNLLDRGIEAEVLPCCLDLGLAVTPWSPLGGGWLTGKYARDRHPSGATRLGEDPNRGVEAYGRRNNDHTWQVLDAVREVSTHHGVPMSHVAISWLLGRPGVASVLLGARTPEQLAETIQAADLQLSSAQRHVLTNVSAPGLAPYPYEMIAEFCGVDHWDRLHTRAAN